MLKLSMAAFSLGLILAGPALAQNNNPACNKTEAINSQSPFSNTASTTSMAATSSDSGNHGTGASSASIGTGPIDKTGVNNPCVPGTSGHGETGALPNPTPSSP